MNLTNFLNQMDAITVLYSASQLASFVHDIGRILPEDQREDFLRRLKAIGEGTSNIDETKELALNEMHKHVRNNLKIIDSQEVMIEGILNEEYDDWYDDCSEEFY